MSDEVTAELPAATTVQETLLAAARDALAKTGLHAEAIAWNDSLRVRLTYADVEAGRIAFHTDSVDAAVALAAIAIPIGACEFVSRGDHAVAEQPYRTHPEFLAAHAAR